MVENLLKQAKKLFDSGDFNKALKLIDKALAKDIMNGEGWYLRGKCYAALGNEQEALRSYREMEEVGGNPLVAFTNTVLSIARVGHTGERIKQKRKYIDPHSISGIYMQNEELWVQKAAAFQGFGDYESAIACYYRALELNPNYEPAIKNKQYILQMMGWKDGNPWELFVEDVLSQLSHEEREILVKLRKQTNIGIQLEDEIKSIPDTSDDVKISVQIEDNKVTGLGIFHVFKEIPAYICGLKNLTSFYCNGEFMRYKISLIPEEFRNLKLLKKVDMRRNDLSILPDWLGELSNLEWLGFQRNKLTKLPDSITNLSRLRTLDVRYNELTSLPEKIGDCTELWWLDVGFNKLRNLPESLCKLNKLDTLKISNNLFPTSPDIVNNLRNMGVDVDETSNV
ncbi:MAG: tetratricopeptide repeat protein [Candidatus Thorarchaeota archaeon]